MATRRRTRAPLSLADQINRSLSEYEPCLGYAGLRLDMQAERPGFDTFDTRRWSTNPLLPTKDENDLLDSVAVEEMSDLVTVGSTWTGVLDIYVYYEDDDYPGERGNLADNTYCAIRDGEILGFFGLDYVAAESAMEEGQPEMAARRAVMAEVDASDRRSLALDPALAAWHEPLGLPAAHFPGAPSITAWQRLNAAFDTVTAAPRDLLADHLMTLDGIDLDDAAEIVRANASDPMLALVKLGIMTTGLLENPAPTPEARARRRETNDAFATIARAQVIGDGRDWDKGEGNADVGGRFWHPEEKIADKGTVEVAGMPGGDTEEVHWCFADTPKIGNQRALRRVLMSFNAEHTVCYGGALLIHYPEGWCLNSIYVVKDYAKALRALGIDLMARSGAVAVLEPMSTAARIAARHLGLPTVDKADRADTSAPLLENPAEAPKWQRLYETFANGSRQWTGEYNVTVDGVDYRVSRDPGGSTITGTTGVYMFVPALDTTTPLNDFSFHNRDRGVQHGGWSRAECVEAMRALHTLRVQEPSVLWAEINRAQKQARALHPMLSERDSFSADDVGDFVNYCNEAMRAAPTGARQAMWSSWTIGGASLTLRNSALQASGPYAFPSEEVNPATLSPTKMTDEQCDDVEATGLWQKEQDSIWFTGMPHPGLDPADRRSYPFADLRPLRHPRRNPRR